jgi:hypothetical protein
MNLRKHAADAIARLRDLAGEILIETTQHRQFGVVVVGDLQRAQRLRHTPRGFGDDGRIARIRLRLSRMQVGDPRIASPGRYATVTPSARATATGSAPTVAG